MRSSIVENMASALTAQKAVLNNFEDIVNCRVDIHGDIKHYQDTLSYSSSKVNYSMGDNIYMLPSDMSLNIRSGSVGYNKIILVSDEKFSLGKNDKVNALEALAMKSHKPLIRSYNQLLLIKTRNPLTTRKKLLWYFSWQVVLQYGICFSKRCLPRKTFLAWATH